MTLATIAVALLVNIPSMLLVLLVLWHEGWPHSRGDN